MIDFRSKSVYQILVFFGLFVVCHSISFSQDARLIAKNSFPSVVLLEMRDSNNLPTTLGSGFFVSPDVVVTNYHVIDGASNGSMKIVGQTTIHQIEGVVGIDKVRDLALLKVVGVKGKPLRLADISKIEVGQEVFAIGNPKGLEGTISPGIVSGSSLREIENESYIQITAPISPGSSGGPVVNKEGEVIGVAVASLRGGQNLNFAIPSSYLALLLANAKGVTSLADATRSFAEKKQSKQQPTFAETTEWLTSKLEGTEYFVQSQSSAVGSLARLEVLRFNNCQMRVEVRYRTGNIVGIQSTKISLDSITEAEADLSKANTVGIWLSLQKKVVRSYSSTAGDNQTELIDELKIPAPDLELGERAVKAFKQLAISCKEASKSEPF